MNSFPHTSTFHRRQIECVKSAAPPRRRGVEILKIVGGIVILIRHVRCAAAGSGLRGLWDSGWRGGVVGISTAAIGDHVNDQVFANLARQCT